MRQGLTTGRHPHAERGKHVDFGLEVMMGAVGPIDEGASPLKSPLNLTKANKICIYDASAPKQIFTRTGATNTCTPEASLGAVGLDPGQGVAGKNPEKGDPTGA